MHADLEKTIFRTLIFFDMIEYPLTLLEVQRHLLFLNSEQNFSYSDVLEIFSSSQFLSENIEEHCGYYHLKGRSALADIRRERTIYADQKYRKAQMITRILAMIPFVRMVCVCNTVGLGAVKDKSDIDLFIVARARHLWLTRLLCTGFVHLLGRRPRKNAVRNTFCLSFYVSDDALNMQPLCLDSLNEVPDVYFLYWLTWCVPIYDDGSYESFFIENNWIERYLPNRLRSAPVPYRRVQVPFVGCLIKRALEIFCSIFGGGSEYMARALQQAIMPQVLRERQSDGVGVVVSDTILKFHITDRRKDIQEEFVRRCVEAGIL